MRGSLAGAERLLVDVSAALASRERASLSHALDTALSEGIDAGLVEEVLLQGYLFLGYPTVIEALDLWRQLSGRKAAEPPADDPAGWQERGEEVCKQVYGGQYENLRQRVRGLHPELEAWMVSEGYGKVLGRSGLQLRTRELCIVALLAVSGASKQLHSHLRGSLNVGAKEGEVEEALARALRYATPTEAGLARETWGQVLTRWREKRGPRRADPGRGSAVE